KAETEGTARCALTGETMRRDRRALPIVFALVVLAVAGPLPVPAEQPPVVNDRIRLLEAWIESQMAYRGQPGLSIGIVQDQDLVWSRGYGFADREGNIPATPDTLYRIASITKTFTATAIMQLRDQGRLELDDPVSKHLSWFRVRPREAGGHPITIRHLLTHVSGLPREADSPYWTTDEFPTREEIIKALPDYEQTFNAETRWKYSNLAVAIAGEVVAAVSGEPWDRYVKGHILDPLGMRATLTDSPRAQVPGLATAYGRRLRDLSRPPRLNSAAARGLAPAAGMMSSVTDLSRYVALQFRAGPDGGNQVLSGATLAEMHRVHWLNPDWQSGQG